MVINRFVFNLTKSVRNSKIDSSESYIFFGEPNKTLETSLILNAHAVDIPAISIKKS